MKQKSNIKVAVLTAFSLAAFGVYAQKRIPPPPPPPPITCGRDEVTDFENGVFTIVEQNPEFKQGMKAMYMFFKDSLQYPKVAQENGIQGTVYVGFVVEKDGRLTNAHVKRGIGGGCNEEAVRLIYLMSGKWKAAKQSGLLVRCAYTLPVKFKLDE